MDEMSTFYILIFLMGTAVYSAPKNDIKLLMGKYDSEPVSSDLQQTIIDHIQAALGRNVLYGNNPATTPNYPRGDTDTIHIIWPGFIKPTYDKTGQIQGNELVLDLANVSEEENYSDDTSDYEYPSSDDYNGDDDAETLKPHSVVVAYSPIRISDMGNGLMKVSYTVHQNLYKEVVKIIQV